MDKCHQCDYPSVKQGVDENDVPIALCDTCCCCYNCQTQEFEELTSDLWKLTKECIRPAGWIFQHPSGFQTVSYYQLYCTCCKDLWCGNCFSLSCHKRCDDCCAACSDPCSCPNTTNSPETIPLELHTTPEVPESHGDLLLPNHPHQNSSHALQPLPKTESVLETPLQTHNMSPES